MMLDIIREPVPGRPAAQLSEEAEHEEALCNFERYRDLVRLARTGYATAPDAADERNVEERGIAKIEREELDRRVVEVGHTAPTAKDIKAEQRAAGVGSGRSGPVPGGPGAAGAASAAGKGIYANVGFSYGAGGTHATELEAAAAAAVAAAADAAGAAEEDVEPSEESSSEGSWVSDCSDDPKASAIAESFGIGDLRYHLREEVRCESTQSPRKRRRASPHPQDPPIQHPTAVDSLFPFC